MRANNRSGRRGGALLIVLWLSAALAAIAFTVASTVRGETGRVSNSVDGLKAQYLAAGAVQRAMLYVEWGARYRGPDGTPLYFSGMPRFPLEFASGHAQVEVIPESSKLNVNTSPPEDLFRLLAVLGVEPDRARQIVLALVDWRSPAPPGAASPFDQRYLGRNPSFLARHASLEEIEELLLIQGVTPELFYGTYERDTEGVLRLHRGLRDCLSVYGGTTQIDANTAQPEVLETIGLTPESVAELIRRRSVRPLLPSDLGEFGENLPGFRRLGVARSAYSTATVRATAWPRRPDGSLSDARRSVAALVSFLDPEASRDPHHILRWYGNVQVD
ncbi:MAG TPA: hypothetical protein VF767_01580 [Bryobacteraceae bacterium]